MLLRTRMARAVRKRSPLALLVEIDHPDGTVRYWSGIGTLDHGGYEWRGAGHLGSIQIAPRVTDLRIDEIKMSLRGIGPEDAVDVNMDIRNRKAWVWIAALDDAQHVIDDPLLIDEILLDYATDEIGEDGTVAITLTGQTGFWTLERTTEAAWSMEDAVARWGEGVETGFDYITSLRLKDTKWASS